MGHSEMLLAVAGLPSEAVTDITRRLNSGDWSSFSPAHQLAFRCAWQLSRAPWTFGEAERAGLVAAFGRERATDVIWHVAWANYMTRFADAFQLPLERENVFAKEPPAGG
jgi:hypothetical protein